MALTEQVIMPGADYQAICDSVRTLDGSTAVLKSGDVSGKVDAANSEISNQTDLIAQIKTALEGKAAGGGRSVSVFGVTSGASGYNFLFEEGMTWDDFCSSIYNLNGRNTIFEEFFTPRQGYDRVDANLIGMNICVSTDGTFNGKVKLSDKIIPEYRYKTYFDD